MTAYYAMPTDLRLPARGRIMNDVMRSTLAGALLLVAACAPRYQPPAEISPPPPPLPPVEAPIPIAEPVLAPPPADRETVGLPGVYADAFDMPIHVNQHVLEYIDMFTGRARARFETWLQRQGQYEPLISGRLRERGMPAELIHLALIESGYVPTAVSHANAVGLWQFIASTGRAEGLAIEEFLDERRDPVRATDAALQHLQRLYDRFGSWYLAAAAYNAGAGRIERALAAGVDGRRGDDSLFWAIRHLLPTETRNYVPQLIAASIIGTHRQLFGLDHVVPAAPLAYDIVDVPAATDFSVLADAAGVDQRVIAAYNPHFHREVTPARHVELRLPIGTADRFRVAYAAVPPDQRIRTRTHVVAAGETLSAIAARYGTTVSSLQNANDIAQADRIAIGRRLIVPAARAAAATVATATPAAPAATSGPAPTMAATRTAPAPIVTHRVQHGDTLYAIARAYGVSAQQLMQWNALDSDLIRPGDRIQVRR